MQAFCDQICKNWQFEFNTFHIIFKTSNTISIQFKPFAPITYLQFLLPPMVVLAPVSATLDPPLSPPSTPADIFWRTCLGGGCPKKWPFQAILSTFRFFQKNPK